MSLKFLLSFAVLMYGVAASISYVNGPFANEARLCGTEEPSENHKAFTQLMLERETTAPRRKSPFTVDVYYHIITASEAESNNTSDEVIARQMDVVGAAFAPHGISFNFLETVRTVNADWAVGNGIPQMKAELRRGSYSTLNIYAVDDIGGGLFGFCPFPEFVSEGDAVFLEDGCTIIAGVMPGGHAAPYNQGRVLVHEIGHWMDLFHTFQDGCFPGDRVDDTPAQAIPLFECDPNVVYDTCPDDPGTDAVHNWMNNGGDPCWEEFTPGQEARMYSAWHTYRKGSV